MISLFDGFFDHIKNVAVFAANIDEAAIRIDGAARNDHTLDQLMRIHLHQRTVFTRARLRLVRVANNVFRLRIIFRHEGPLHPRRKTSATSAAQVGFLDFVDDRRRRHLFQRFFERLIAAMLQINIDLAGILNPPKLAD